MKSLFGIIITFLFLFSCTNSENLFNDTLGDKSKLFRGLTINDSLQKVKNTENPDALVREEDYRLSYKYKYKQGTLKIEYAFDEIGLYKLESRISSNKTEISTKLWKDLFDYYTSKYGKSKTTDASETWLFDENKKILELRHLTVETEISLTFEALE